VQNKPQTRWRTVVVALEADIVVVYAWYLGFLFGL
jgi:hypothetical protein